MTDAVVEIPGFLVVVYGNGGPSVRNERNRKHYAKRSDMVCIQSTTLVPKNLHTNLTLPMITSLFLTYLNKLRTNWLIKKEEKQDIPTSMSLRKCDSRGWLPCPQNSTLKSSRSKAHT